MENIKFNALVPELSVTDIERSKWFYIELLGFNLEYEREADKFIYFVGRGSTNDVRRNQWLLGHCRVGTSIR